MGIEGAIHALGSAEVSKSLIPQAESSNDVVLSTRCKKNSEKRRDNLYLPEVHRMRSEKYVGGKGVLCNTCANGILVNKSTK